MTGYEKSFEERMKSRKWYVGVEGFALGSRHGQTWFLVSPEDALTRIVHGHDGMAAVRVEDRRTDVIIREEWRINRLHRDEGPARILRDAKTGVVVREEWYQHGKRQRTDGPAMIKYDRVSGEVICEGFYQQGKMISERLYPEKEVSTTRREIGARARWARARLKSVDAAPL